MFHFTASNNRTSTEIDAAAQKPLPVHFLWLQNVFDQ